MSTLAEVRLWGSTIGAVVLEDGAQTAAFEYDRGFTASGIEVAPLTMPLGDRVYTFPALPVESFHGLPGLLADSLPDRFGNALIDAWLATQGRTPESFNAVERLCYTGARGMGALEFLPATGPKPRGSTRLHVDRLVALASEVLRHRSELQTSLPIRARRRPFGTFCESAPRLVERGRRRSLHGIAKLTRFVPARSRRVRVSNTGC